MNKKNVGREIIIEGRSYIYDEAISHIMTFDQFVDDCLFYERNY